MEIIKRKDIPQQIRKSLSKDLLITIKGKLTKVNSIKIKTSELPSKVYSIRRFGKIMGILVIVRGEDVFFCLKD
jgi:hypothetical protein